jgi:hypothetical protein
MANTLAYYDTEQTTGVISFNRAGYIEQGPAEFQLMEV